MSDLPEMRPSAEERLALSYEKRGRAEGPYPSYAKLARERRGSFTICSIEAIEAAFHDGILAERAMIRICSVCGDATDLACSDCRIDFQTSVYVCRKPECRDQHETRCPSE